MGIVDVKPLKDIVDTAERLGAAVMAAEDMPGAERQRYRDVVAATFDVLHQAVSLPANRLTQLLNVADDQAFVRGLAELGHFEPWERVERAAFLCEPLRACGREMDGLFDALKGRLALRDRKKLVQLVQGLLGGEAEFAYAISASLQRLGAMADAARSSPAGTRKARLAVERTRDNLQDLRRRLLVKQVEFYEVI